MFARHVEICFRCRSQSHTGGLGYRAKLAGGERESSSSGRRTPRRHIGRGPFGRHSDGDWLAQRVDESRGPELDAQDAGAVDRGESRAPPC